MTVGEQPAVPAESDRGWLPRGRQHRESGLGMTGVLYPAEIRLAARSRPAGIEGSSTAASFGFDVAWRF